MLSRPGATLLDIVPTVVQAPHVGVAALRLLAVQRVWTAPDDEGEQVDTTRRTWLATAGVLGFWAATGLLGFVVTRVTSSVAAERQISVLPRSRVPAPRCCPTSN